MGAEYLSQVENDLVKRYGTRDPFRIAKELGIIVLDDCDNFGPLKGMYRIIKRNRFIFLNKDLSPEMKRIVCAHELGHDQLHRHLAASAGLQEFSFLLMGLPPFVVILGIKKAPVERCLCKTHISKKTRKKLGKRGGGDKILPQILPHYPKI